MLGHIGSISSILGFLYLFYEKPERYSTIVLKFPFIETVGWVCVGLVISFYIIKFIIKSYKKKDLAFFNDSKETLQNIEEKYISQSCHMYDFKSFQYNEVESDIFYLNKLESNPFYNKAKIKLSRDLIKNIDDQIFSLLNKSIICQSPINTFMTNHSSPITTISNETLSNTIKNFNIYNFDMPIRWNSFLDIEKYKRFVYRRDFEKLTPSLLILIHKRYQTRIPMDFFIPILFISLFYKELSNS